MSDVLLRGFIHLTREERSSVLSKITVKYSSKIAWPWLRKLGRRDPTKVYARTLGNTIYFDKPKAHMLRDDGISLIFEKLFRHELEHMYQSYHYGKWSFSLYYWYFIFNALLKQPLKPYEAYLSNPFEISAEVASRVFPLTLEEQALFVQGKE